MSKIFKLKYNLKIFFTLILCIVVLSFGGCGTNDFESDMLSESELDKIENNSIDMNGLFDNIPSDDSDTNDLQDAGSKEVSEDKTSPDIILPIIHDNSDTDAIVDSNGTDIEKGSNQQNTKNGVVAEPLQENNQDNSEIDVNSPSEQRDNDQTITYVLNKNTKKFHFEYCKSVPDIKPKNRDTATDRNSIIERGFVPCKRCNP